MSKAIQYMVNTNGVYTTQQFQLTTEDLELATGVTANYICSCKGSDDTIYILCGMNENVNRFGKIIKITSNGTTTISQFSAYGDLIKVCVWNSTFPSSIALNRSEDCLFIRTMMATSGGFWSAILRIPITALQSPTIQDASYNIFNTSKIQLYRDLYIWGLSGSVVSIYNQSTPYDQIAVSGSIGNIRSISVDNNNQCWVGSTDVDNNSYLNKLIYNGVSFTTTIYLLGISDIIVNAKQSLIDKWGDLIIITNEGTTSNLIKINLTGTSSIIDNIDLGGVRYNLNTDKDGTYFYSNNLNTWKIPANTAQGQVFSATKTVIRGTGMITYGNDITGYMVSVNSSVGC